jgi:hypothetical protein
LITAENHLLEPTRKKHLKVTCNKSNEADAVTRVKCMEEVAVAPDTMSNMADKKIIGDENNE